MKNRPSRLRQLLYAAVLPVGLLLIWEILSRQGFISPQILPAPSQVFLRWIDYLEPHDPYNAEKSNIFVWLFSGELPHDALASSCRVLGGFAIATVLALILGLLMGARYFCIQSVQSVDSDLEAHTPYCIHPARHPLVRARQSPCVSSHQPWRFLPGVDEHGRRGPSSRSYT